MADRAHRKKLLRTLCIFFCFFAAGISVSQTGPALLDLQLITNTTTQQASAFITSSSVGSMVGSLSAGFIYGRWNKVSIMALLSFLTAVSVTALPWCSPYPLMIVMHGLVTMFRSSFSTAVTVDVIRTWAPDSRVMLQIFNTCFSFGGTLAPLLTQPFLAPLKQGNTTENSTENSGTNFSSFNCTTAAQELPETHVQFSYLITGVLFLTGSCMFTIQRNLFREKTTLSGISEKSSGSYMSLEDPLPRSVFVVTMIMLFFMFFLFVSSNLALSSYLLTFCVKYLKWTKSTGANLTTVLWLSNAICRFITIFFTKFVAPHKLVFVSSVVNLFATTGNIVSCLYHFDTGVWVCIGVNGLCFSTQVSSLLMWTEESIVRITPKMMSVFHFAVTCPGMVIPQILGYLMQEMTPMWLFYLNVIQCLILLILMLFAYFWTRCVI